MRLPFLTSTAVAALLVLAPTASAGLVAASGDRGLLVDMQGDGASVLLVGLYSEPSGLTWIAESSTDALAPGPGCSRITAASVRCPRQGGRGVDVVLGDGNDRMFPRTGTLSFVDPVRADLGQGSDGYGGFAGPDVVSGGTGPDSLVGNGGDDQLSGGGDADQITPGAGRDVASGDSGNDVFFDRVPAGTDPAAEDDQYSGGTGFDVVSYDQRGATLILGAELEATGGQIGAGEGDGLRGLERYSGSTGDDRMNLSFGAVPAELFGGLGNDQLVGSDGVDTLVGGSGADLLSGKAGNDTIDAKAGEPTAVADPTVDCGTGTDFALLDLKDDATPAGCEAIDRAPANERPDAKLPRALSLRGRGGEASVPVTCPRSRTRGCEGTVRLRRGERSYRAARYDLRRGDRRRVRVEAPFRGNGVVETEEKGVIGPKSVTRPVRVR